MACTSDDVVKLSGLRKFNPEKRRTWSFVRRNRAFTFNKNCRPGAMQAQDFPMGQIVAPERRYAVLNLATFVSSEATLVTWIDTRSPDACAFDVCAVCAGRFESVDHAVKHMRPGVMDEKPDTQPDALPWGVQSHLGCMSDPTRQQRLYAQDDDDNAGLQWMRARKLREGSCYKCPKLVTVDTLRDFAFDHLDPLRKSFDIGLLAPKCKTGATVALLDAEADKCKLICRDCHPQRTAEQWKSGEVYRGIHADRAAERMPHPDEGCDRVCEELREESIDILTDKEYTRLFCAAQPTNCLGDKRPRWWPPATVDRDTIRRAEEAKWDIKNPPPSPKQASKRAKLGDSE